MKSNFNEVEELLNKKIESFSDDVIFNYQKSYLNKVLKRNKLRLLTILNLVDCYNLNIKSLYLKYVSVYIKKDEFFIHIDLVQKEEYKVFFLDKNHELFFQKNFKIEEIDEVFNLDLNKIYKDYLNRKLIEKECNIIKENIEFYLKSLNPTQKNLELLNIIEKIMEENQND